MGITPSKFRGPNLPSSSGLDSGELKSAETAADNRPPSAGQFSRRREDPKSQDRSANRTEIFKPIKDVYDKIAQAANEAKNIAARKFVEAKEISITAFKENSFSQRTALTNPTSNEILRLRGGAPNPTSTHSTISSIPAINQGARPHRFVQAWESAGKEVGHYNKHVVIKKEFSFMTMPSYSQAAFAFFEKPILAGAGPDIIEKLAKTGISTDLNIQPGHWGSSDTSQQLDR